MSQILLKLFLQTKLPFYSNNVKHNIKYFQTLQTTYKLRYLYFYKQQLKSYVNYLRSYCFFFFFFQEH